MLPFFEDFNKINIILQLSALGSKLFLIVKNSEIILIVIFFILVWDHVERIAKRSTVFRTLDNDIELRNKILHGGACTRDGQLLIEKEREDFPS